MDDVDVLFRFGTLRPRVVIGRGVDVRELLIMGRRWRSHAVCGVYVFDRGHDVDGLIRGLACWRGPSYCEDVGIGFRLLVGDFRHGCGCLCSVLQVGDKEVVVVEFVKLCWRRLAYADFERSRSETIRISMARNKLTTN